MQDGFLKVGAATPNIVVADPKTNALEVIRQIKNAHTHGVKLLVFPELCLSGYTCGDLFFQSTLIEACEEALSEIAAKMPAGIIAVIGTPFLSGNKLYNCAVVMMRNNVLGIIPKTYIPSYREFYEDRYFEPGDNKVIFKCREMPEFTFGAEICEDLWATDSPSLALAKGGANIILNLSASPETLGKNHFRRQLVSTQSSKLISAYVYASAGEGESTTDSIFSAHNIICENGKILAESKLFENELIITEIDLEKNSFERVKNTSFKPNFDNINIINFSMKKEETSLTRFVSKTPFIPIAATERDERCKDILTMQSLSLKKRVKHTFAKTVVLGISGGLDSCLALLVAVKTMELLDRSPKDVVAVTMPCFGTTERTKSNAEKLCELLGVTFMTVDITKAVEQHFADISQPKDKYDVTFENAQARERTQVLMDIANQKDGFIIGTGDLSELALGWGTYGGDLSAMYGVNASVPKTLVRHIVKYYADTAEDLQLSAVLNDILDTPVSPELLPPNGNEIAQITEDVVGPYELHDFFLYYVVRFSFSPKKVLRLAVYAFGNDYDREVILKWLKVFYQRFITQQFKRSSMPDGVKIGSVSLSPRGDLKMPSDASARIWLDELESL